MDDKNVLGLVNGDIDFKTDEELDSYSEMLLSSIDSGAVLKDIHGVSSDTMQEIYKLAFDFYHHGKLNDAESLFRFLCIYDFYNPEYAIGLGAVYQLKKNYAKAIDFYALAYSLSKNDYRPMFYAGQCNLLLRKEAQARKCFEVVCDRCGDVVLNEKSKNYLSALNKVKRSKAKHPEKNETMRNKNEYAHK